jgi:hypothetical protein
MTVRRACLVVAVGVVFGATSASAQAAAPTYAGGRLATTAPPTATNRQMVGIVLQPRGARLALRFDTTVRCGPGLGELPVSGRRTVPFDGSRVAASAASVVDEGAGRRLTYSWSIAGAVADGQATGTLHITGRMRTRAGRSRSCSFEPDRPWQALLVAPPAGGPAAPGGGAVLLGASDQPIVDGLPGAVLLRTTRDGRRVAARWTAAGRCRRGPRELLQNFTPATALRGTSFASAERFTQRFSDAVVRYRVRFAGRFAADGASGTLRVRASEFDARGARLRTRCDSGTRRWTARPAPTTPPATGPGTTTGAAPGVVPSPLPPEEPVILFPADATFSFTSDPGANIGQGRSGTFVQGPARIDVRVWRNWIGFVIFNADTLDEWSGGWSVPAPQRLAVGTYPNAHGGFVPDGQPPGPGIDMSANSRGCNQATGTFTIDALTVDQFGIPRSAVIRWEHHCAAETAATRGTFSFSSP